MGFVLDFQSGHLRVPEGKLKAVRKELGNFLTHNRMSCRKVAAILGVTRALLPALPFLRCFTNLMAQFANQHVQFGWDQLLPVGAKLVQQAKEVKDLLVQNRGRPFLDNRPFRQLHADASNHGWAGLDTSEGRAIQEFWRQDAPQHINWKELWASVHTVLSFTRPGEKVRVHVDNTVA